MTTSNQPQRKTPIWLLLSLAVNFLLVGILIGRMPGPPSMGPHREAGRPHPGPGFYLPPIGRVADQLSDETRELYRRNMAEARPEFRRVRRQLREARLETMRVLTQEPFDIAKFEEAIERHQEIQSKSHAIAQAAIVDFMSDLTDEQRAEFAAALQQALERRRNRISNRGEVGQRPNKENGRAGGYKPYGDQRVDEKDTEESSSR